MVEHMLYEDIYLLDYTQKNTIQMSENFWSWQLRETQNLVQQTFVTTLICDSFFFKSNHRKINKKNNEVQPRVKSDVISAPSFGLENYIQTNFISRLNFHATTLKLSYLFYFSR